MRRSHIQIENYFSFHSWISVDKSFAYQMMKHFSLGLFIFNQSETFTTCRMELLHIKPTTIDISIWNQTYYSSLINPLHYVCIYIHTPKKYLYERIKKKF